MVFDLEGWFLWVLLAPVAIILLGIIRNVVAEWWELQRWL